MEKLASESLFSFSIELAAALKFRRFRLDHLTASMELRLQRLQILNHLPLLLLTQFESERMALIAQAGQRCVNDSSPSFSRRVFRRGRVERFDLQSQILRVILFGPADATEIFRAGLGSQHAVNSRHGAVVKIW